MESTTITATSPIPNTVIEYYPYLFYAKDDADVITKVIIWHCMLWVNEGYAAVTKDGEKSICALAYSSGYSKRLCKKKLLKAFKEKYIGVQKDE